jgi:hypothetical protein
LNLSAEPSEGQSFCTQKSIQFRLESSPAPADFFGPDFTGCNAFHIGRAGYFKIPASLFGGENVILTVSVFTSSPFTITIQSPVETATPVKSSAYVYNAATLLGDFVYHKCFSH